MATGASQQKRPDHGIIILGNSGSGKSFLCNVLIDRKQFATDYRPRAVTMETEYCQINVNGVNLMIFNIPGLIEDDQEIVEQNKREIMRAFQECPMSVVLFVWANNNGRVRPDDVIAFAALYKAYEFATKSLVYVFNNLQRDRDQTFEADFLTHVKAGLRGEGLDIDPEDAVLIDTINFENEEERRDVRCKILDSVWRHYPVYHQQRSQIILNVDELEMLREDSKRHQAEAQADREKYELMIEKMTRKIKDFEAKRRSNPTLDIFRLPIEVVAAPIATATGGIQGGVRGAVRGAVSGFKTIVDRFADFINDSDKPGVLRAAAAPVVTGAIAIVGGTAADVVEVNPSSRTNIQRDINIMLFSVDDDVSSLVDLSPNIVQFVTDKQLKLAVSQLEYEKPFVIVSPKQPTDELLSNAQLVRYYWLKVSEQYPPSKLSNTDRVTSIGTINDLVSKLYHDLGEYYRERAEQALGINQKHNAADLLAESIRYYEMLKKESQKRLKRYAEILKLQGDDK